MLVLQLTAGKPKLFRTSIVSKSKCPSLLLASSFLMLLSREQGCFEVSSSGPLIGLYVLQNLSLAITEHSARPEAYATED